MIHEMHIAFEKSYRKILKDGSGYHVRRYDIKRKLILPKDIILLRCSQRWDEERDNLETVPVVVDSIHIFRSLDDLFGEIPPRECGFSASTSVQTAVSQIKDYYRDDESELPAPCVAAFRFHVLERFSSDELDLLEHRFQEEKRRNNYRYVIDCR